MREEPVHPDPGGRIAERGRVLVPRENGWASATVIDNQGPAYLVRFDDGVERWYDRAEVELNNPAPGERA